MSFYKTPLSVCVLFDKQYEQGINIYNRLYNNLCREPNEPLSDGLDIPVFYYTDGENYQLLLNSQISDKTVFILLVDEKMFDSSYWKTCIDDLLNRSSRNEVKIIPVSLFKYAFEIHSGLQKIQFIQIDGFDVLSNWNYFLVRLYDSLLRIIKGNDANKIKLFISHSKKDNNNIGETKAKELRDYLRRDSKLDTFFDANDIVEGYSFKNQIENNIKDSILLILETSTYSSREWCRIETLIGKEAMVPIVVVSLLEGRVQRSFPYLGNVPKIRFHDSWDEVILLLLRTALDYSYQYMYLSTLVKSLDVQKACVLPAAPELLLIQGKENVQNYIYPEPPLGSEEMDVIKKHLHSEVQVATPCQLYKQNRQICEGVKVAISVSECPDATNYGVGEKMFQDISVELARHLLVVGCTLVYGGDLREGGFTELFSELSYQYGINEKTDVNSQYFENYFPWPVSNLLNHSDLVEFKHKRVKCIKAHIPAFIPQELHNEYIKPDSTENKGYWRVALSSMRKQMEQEIQARIVLGGKISNYLGEMPGIYEETLLAFESHHPIYVLGGFGGAAKNLADLLDGKCTAIDLGFSKLEVLEGKIDELNNGLSIEENRILFYSLNITEIINLILKGLSAKYSR